MLTDREIEAIITKYNCWTADDLIDTVRLADALGIDALTTIFDSGDDSAYEILSAAFDHNHTQRNDPQQNRLRFVLRSIAMSLIMLVTSVVQS
jgi:hypothetical protein